MSDRIIDVLRLDITTPEHQILKATTDALREHDGNTDVDLVRHLIDQYRAGQLAVVGALATLTALTRGQADVLLVTASSDAVHDDTDVGAQGPADPEADPGEAAPIAERLVRLARTTGARVTFIEDPALLADVGGVGALLRYRIQPVAPATDQTLQGTR